MELRTSSNSGHEGMGEAPLVVYRATNIKVLFLSCYKNASSSLFVWLAGLELRSSSGVNNGDFGVPLSRGEAAECLDRDEISRHCLDEYVNRYSDHFIFGISRNPYHRIASAYRNKINRLVKQTMPGVYAKALIRQIMEGPNSWLDNRSAIRHMGQMVSFGDFLQKLASVGLGIDGHYQQQAVLMRPDLLPVAKFFKLENLGETLVQAMGDHLSGHMYGSGLAVEGIPVQNSMGSSLDYRDFYDDELLALVENLYAPDFQLFGYIKGDF
jgi:hypothetical protein